MPCSGIGLSEAGLLEEMQMRNFHYNTLLRKITFDEPLQAKELRLVVTSAYGAEKAHIFGFDAR